MKDRFIKVIIDENNPKKLNNILTTIYTKKLFPTVGNDVESDTDFEIKYEKRTKQYFDGDGNLFREYDYDAYVVDKDTDIRQYYIPVDIKENYIILYWRTELSGVDDEELELVDFKNYVESGLGVGNNMNIILLPEEQIKSNDAINAMFNHKRTTIMHMEWVQPGGTYLIREKSNEE